MSSFGYFCYLAGTTIELMAYLAIITCPLLVLVVLPIIVWTLDRKGVKRRRVLISCVAPVVIPISHLIIGVAFVRPQYTAWGVGVHPPVPWFTGYPTIYPMTALDVLMWLHLPLALVFAWWARRGWPAAVVASLWWAWVSECVSGAAEMSVTGNWL